MSPGIQEYVSPLPFLLSPKRAVVDVVTSTQLEGFTFYYYLQHHSLPTLEEAQASLVPPTPQPAASASDSASVPASDVAETAATEKPAETAPYFRITVDDYLGGVADLTGELMRLAIASVGKNLSDSLAGGDGGGDFANIDKIGRLVREIKGGDSRFFRPHRS